MTVCCINYRSTRTTGCASHEDSQFTRIALIQIALTDAGFPPAAALALPVPSYFVSLVIAANDAVPIPIGFNDELRRTEMVLGVHTVLVATGSTTINKRETDPVGPSRSLIFATALVLELPIAGSVNDAPEPEIAI